MLSIEEIGRWCLRRKRRPDGFVLRSFLRAINFDRKDYERWLQGKRQLPLERQRIISRFIEDWESGMVEFRVRSRKGVVPRDGLGKRGGIIYDLHHRSTPRPMPIRMNVDLSSGRARLSFVPKPERLRMPSFPDVAGALRLDGKVSKD